MPKISAGILLYRLRRGTAEVLLVHPGGPFWRNKDAGAWMIPKGEVAPGEAPLACALREFEEELGVRPEGSPRPLSPVRQAGGKRVEAFALEGELDPDRIVSNRFEMEWPPRSGRLQSFPEVDRAGWLPLAEAREKILARQRPMLDELAQMLGVTPPGDRE
ncbi:NUDIX domain-containing protein [Sphingosinicella humi]|uniref:NUDIX hydrolase n=1 Tax=Allosphingosinicella humi TaxID=2068657 RepID=A0A2U2J458_9SPHN|nr:NUDIX domain-containing protein [Sphingosinicella humi]PWG03104.1 NUDIX hydrolase [Sphingosinicella humi]